MLAGSVGLVSAAQQQLALVRGHMFDTGLINFGAMTIEKKALRGTLSVACGQNCCYLKRAFNLDASGPINGGTDRILRELPQ